MAVDERARVRRAPGRGATNARPHAPGPETPRTCRRRARRRRWSGPGRASCSSSRSPRMQDGSSPTIGTPRAANGAERVEQAPRFGARGVEHAGREIRPAAAQRAAVARRRRSHGVAAGRQHRDGGAQVLGLEIGIEGVREQHDLARRRRARAAAARRARSRENSRAATSAAFGAAANPATTSESLASPGMRSRRFRSGAKRAAARA